MTKIIWDTVGSRFYEAGIDRAVLYVDGGSGVPWNGLTSVTERSSESSGKSLYLDGEKYLNLPVLGEFEGSITAYTYPDEFSICDGSLGIRSGLYLTHQRRKTFGLSYRSFIGDDINGVDGHYKIHIIYEALASPSDTNRKSLGSSNDPVDFTWDITAKAPLMDGYRRTAHVVIDSRYAHADIVAAVEDILYGTEIVSPVLPTLSDLITIFDTVGAMTVTDNGDGSFTVVGPDSAITMLDSTTFEIDWPTAIFIDSNTYTISS